MALPKPEFHREFRLGLVVYGGVSLAVYMNGVCREFYNAVRGRGVYKLIKALTDSDIVVDIISGTSAGGINGVLLSYALTNSSEKETFDFKNFSGVWRDSGDINELLREVNSSGDVNSILDGEGYYQNALASAFQSVWEKRKKAPDDDWFSDFSELDLFVTGTDVLGKISRYFDNTGKLIEVNDHHAVFILKHRKNRKTPFQPDDNGITQKALAKLCRITSCFPVAFPVVTVKLKDDTKNPDRKIDQQLVEWGDLNNRVIPKEKPENGYQLHFVDGGVLDNRPFGYTIQEIYYRHFYRSVDRKLFYIDPSPDKFLDSPSFKRMAKPNIWESAIDSLIGLPRYESIAVDLQEIADKNERVRRYKFLRSTVISTAEKTLEDKLQKGEIKIENGKLCPNHDLQKELNLSSLRDNHSLSDDIPSDEQIYLRCRLISLRDRVLPLITGLSQAKDTTPNTDKQKILQTAADLLSYIGDPDKQRDRERYLHEKGYEVQGIDINYSIRKHFFILNEIVKSKEQAEYSEFNKCLENLARYLNRQLSLLEAIKFAIDSMFMIDHIQDDFARLIQEVNKLEKIHEKRDNIFSYLLHFHRYLLDADQLPNESLLENYREDQPCLTSERKSFFQVLSNNLPKTLAVEIDGESHHNSYTWLPSNSIDNILQQLKARANKLVNRDTLDKKTPDSSLIWQDKYRFDGHGFHGILSEIDAISNQLIELLKYSLPDNNVKNLAENAKNLSNKLSLKFCCFESIDQQIYPYEYLSDIRSDDLLEIARISPDDSQKGFGRGKKLEERLAGVQLGAFGGFFKKSWRSNDILWGRLDGLNRLVDCLLTPTAVQSFSGFMQKNKAFDLSSLVNEALPNATEEEGKIILDDITKLSKGEKLSEEDFQKFLENIIQAGQRAILMTDLENVLKDSIEEQFTWNQQLGIPGCVDLRDIGYRSKSLRISSSSLCQQLQGLQKIDTLLDRLLEPKVKLRKLSNIAAGLLPNQSLEIDRKFVDGEISQIPKDKDAASKYLRDLLENAFPHSSENAREELSSRLYWLLSQLNSQRIKRFNDTSNAFAIEFVYAIIPVLETLLEISEEEKKGLDLNASQEISNWIKIFSNQLNKAVDRLKKAGNSFKPKFFPIDGYLDKPLIPFVTGSLVDSSIQDILRDDERIDYYFRYQYRVGSEKVTKNIPPTILNKLLARSGLVIRDILRSEPTGEVLSKSSIFQFVDRLLRTFYFWVDAKDPATSFVPKILRPLLSLILVIALLLGTAFLVSQISRLLLGLIITILIAQLIYGAIGKKESIKRGFKAISLLFVLVILASPLVGLPLPHEGKISLKHLFSDHCPLIKTPWTLKDCKSKHENKVLLSIP